MRHRIALLTTLRRSSHDAEIATAAISSNTLSQGCQCLVGRCSEACKVAGHHVTHPERPSGSSGAPALISMTAWAPAYHATAGHIPTTTGSPFGSSVWRPWSVSAGELARRTSLSAANHSNSLAPAHSLTHSGATGSNIGWRSFITMGAVGGSSSSSSRNKSKGGTSDPGTSSVTWMSTATDAAGNDSQRNRGDADAGSGSGSSSSSSSSDEEGGGADQAADPAVTAEQALTGHRTETQKDELVEQALAVVAGGPLCDHVEWVLGTLGVSRRVALALLPRLAGFSVSYALEPSRLWLVGQGLSNDDVQSIARSVPAALAQTTADLQHRLSFYTESCGMAHDNALALLKQTPGLWRQDMTSPVNALRLSYWEHHLRYSPSQLHEAPMYLTKSTSVVASRLDFLSHLGIPVGSTADVEEVLSKSVRLFARGAFSQFLQLQPPGGGSMPPYAADAQAVHDALLPLADSLLSHPERQGWWRDSLRDFLTASPVSSASKVAKRKAAAGSTKPTALRVRKSQQLLYVELWDVFEDDWRNTKPAGKRVVALEDTAKKEGAKIAKLVREAKAAAEAEAAFAAAVAAAAADGGGGAAAALRRPHHAADDSVAATMLRFDPLLVKGVVMATKPRTI